MTINNLILAATGLGLALFANSTPVKIIGIGFLAILVTLLAREELRARKNKPWLV